jgi:hypothetical protein
MALIECPECGNVTSSEATFCPQCGYAAKKAAPPSPAESGRLAVVPLTMLDITRSIVGRLLVGAGMLASGAAFDAPPAVLLGLVVWGSAVPLYLKARKAQLGPLAGHRALEEAVRKQLTAARDEAQLERSAIEDNAGKIADLEERIDYLERLLARERERS